MLNFTIHELCIFLVVLYVFFVLCVGYVHTNMLEAHVHEARGWQWLSSFNHSPLNLSRLAGQRASGTHLSLPGPQHWGYRYVHQVQLFDMDSGDPDSGPLCSQSSHFTKWATSLFVALTINLYKGHLTNLKGKYLVFLSSDNRTTCRLQLHNNLIHMQNYFILMWRKWHLSFRT